MSEPRTPLESSSLNEWYEDTPAGGAIVASDGDVLALNQGAEKTMGQVVAFQGGIRRLLGSPETRRDARPIYGTPIPLSGTWTFSDSSSIATGQDGQLVEGDEIRAGEMLGIESGGTFRVRIIQAVASDLEFTIEGTFPQAGNGVTLYRMRSAAERMESFIESLPGYAAVDLMPNTTEPPVLSGIMDVDGRIVSVTGSSAATWAENYGSPTAEPGYFYQYFIGGNGTARFHLACGAAIDAGGDGTTSSISKVGARLRYYVADSFSLANDLIDKLLHYRDDTTPDNTGVYRIAAVSNTAGSKYVEVYSSAGVNQGGATGRLELFEPHTIAAAYPALPYDRTRFGYYSPLSSPTVWREAGVFFRSSGGTVERVFARGNQWEWKGGEGIPIGREFDGVTDVIPPYAWLEDGSLIDVDEDPGLFGILGYKNGGSGAQFALPDWLGRFKRFADMGAGRNPEEHLRGDRGDGTTGAAVGTTEEDAIQAHGHNLRNLAGVETAILWFTRQSMGGDSGSLISAAGGSNYGHNTRIGTPSADPVTGAAPRTASETKVKNRTVVPLIKRGPRKWW